MPKFGPALFGYRRDAVDAAVLDLERRFAQLEEERAARAEQAARHLGQIQEQARALEERLAAARRRQDDLLDTLSRIQERGALVTARALEDLELEEREWRQQVADRQAELARLQTLWQEGRRDLEAVVSLYRFLLAGDPEAAPDDPAQARPALSLRAPRAGA
jgi:chromosome segregation ATPase